MCVCALTRVVLVALARRSGERVARIDVVVVTYNSREYVRRLVEPLCGHPDIHVIVVDNNSTDKTLETVADLPIRAIARDDNNGFGFACNVGWRAGDSSYVVFINPDSRVDPEAVLSLVDRLVREPGVGIVGPKIVDEEGHLYQSQRRFASVAISLAAAVFLPRFRPTTRWSLDVADPAAYEAPGSPDWVSGACFATRREVLIELGGFDDGFFLYYEDMDLAKRARELGNEIAYEPNVVVVHTGGASAPRARLVSVMARSRLRYARKHGGRDALLGERLAAMLHYLTHAVLTDQGAEARRGYLRAFGVCVGL